MQIVIYVDVFSFAGGVYPSTDPGPKPSDCTRYKVSFTVPDPRKPDTEVIPDSIEEEPCNE